MKDEVKTKLGSICFRLTVFRRLMRTMLRSTFVIMILATMWFSFGCEKRTGAIDPSSQSTPGSTKPLEAADLVGYDGKRLRKSVDRVKEANEKRNQDAEKMAGSGPDQ
jgi:hypothetical protein